MTAVINSFQAHEDCFEVLDRALESDTGVRAMMDDKGAAIHYRMRLHYARKLDRERSTEAHPTDHPDYGKSVYDNLVVSVREENNTWWIYITTRKAPLVIEDLDDVVPSR
jgi:hypothetical protein